MARLVALLPLGVLGWLVAVAASLALVAGSLGAATVATPRCTNAALSVTPTLAAGSVASVSVGGLPASCGGATLQVGVTNGTTNGTGSAAVPAGGGSVTVTLGTAVPLTATVETDLAAQRQILHLDHRFVHPAIALEQPRKIRDDRFLALVVPLFGDKLHVLPRQRVQRLGAPALLHGDEFQVAQFAFGKGMPAGRARIALGRCQGG